MCDKKFKTRLKSLYPDLTCTCRDALTIVDLMTSSIDDKSEIIRDMYYHDHAPVKVTNTSRLTKGGGYDLEEELISLSEGYDNYLKNMGNLVEDTICRHVVALNILINILSLPDPYAKILYLHYFKRLAVSDIAKYLFTSKTSCYRNIERGTELLYERMTIDEEE